MLQTQLFYFRKYVASIGRLCTNIEHKKDAQKLKNSA